tara:strand:+ start:10 stop:555 length:546 start_codon:yes stop_codon:yes gene_type:complete
MSKTTIPTGGLADSAVTTAKITDATIASGDLADDAVTAAKIADAVGLGKLLQVVQVENNTDLDLSSNTYTDYFSGAITPSASSSKVLVFWTVHSRAMTSVSGFGIRLVRGSTNVWTSTRDYYVYSEDAASDRSLTMLSYLDSPSTTSATTYKIQVACNGSVNIQFSGNSNQSNMTLMEIGA